MNKQNVIFDMETGDPDDLITLLMLILNPDVNLKAVTCWGGTPIQTGLLKHVLNLASLDIPVGGDNTADAVELDAYYYKNVGTWKPALALNTALDVLLQHLDSSTNLLTGAPLTNVSAYLNHGGKINTMTTQGGYLGDLVPVRLDKFKNRSEVPTYNLGNDLDAFNTVNYSDQINSLTYVTKDLCHGFLYTQAFHNTVNFGNRPVSQLLKRCLAHYADINRPKAMHDVLAMLVQLYPELGKTCSIQMSYRMDKGRPVFSSQKSTDTFTRGLIEYDQNAAWTRFRWICEQ